jgi:hypothetical protein
MLMREPPGTSAPRRIGMSRKSSPSVKDTPPRTTPNPALPSRPTRTGTEFYTCPL